MWFSTRTRNGFPTSVTMRGVLSGWRMPNTEADLPFTSIVRRCSRRIAVAAAVAPGPGAGEVCAPTEGGRIAAASAEASNARRVGMASLLPRPIASAGAGRLELLHPQFPAEPVADGTAHDELEVAAFEQRHLFGEHRHALLPRARHAGDVGAPEAALRPEGLDDLLGVFVDVAIGVGLARIAGRAGALDRHIRVPRQLQQGRLVAVRRVVLAVSDAGIMIDQQLQSVVALGDLADQRQIVRRHQ